MKRHVVAPRPDWQDKVESIGFGFHTLDGIYWDERAYYSFALSEIEAIETATNELWSRCLEAVQYVIDHKKYKLFHIPEWIVPHIEKSWQEDTPSVYGRFDFSFELDKNTGRILTPKMLEFNADTPTALFEASVVQWHWLEDVGVGKDQFNSIHEKLIDYWTTTKPYLHEGALHFTVHKESLEDLTTVEYLRDTAIQAGLKTKLIYIEEIGWDYDKLVFKDLEGHYIRNIFKLYPWEWLVHDDFGKCIVQDRNKAYWIEPSWKMILSNKAILPVLWSLFSDCPYLLPAYFDAVDLDSYVKKPILSREGANITLVKDNQYITHTEGDYGEEGFVYQALCPLPKLNNNYALVGSWVIGGEAAGIGIRESDSLITDNMSRFVPHCIE